MVSVLTKSGCGGRSRSVSDEWGGVVGVVGRFWPLMTRCRHAGVGLGGKMVLS